MNLNQNLSRLDEFLARPIGNVRGQVALFLRLFGWMEIVVAIFAVFVGLTIPFFPGALPFDLTVLAQTSVTIDYQLVVQDFALGGFIQPFFEEVLFRSWLGGGVLLSVLGLVSCSSLAALYTWYSYNILSEVRDGFPDFMLPLMVGTTIALLVMYLFRLPRFGQTNALLVAYVSLAFGLPHTINYLLRGDSLPPAILHSFVLVGLGGFLGASRIRFGFTMAVALHIVHNLLTGLAEAVFIFLRAMGLGQTPSTLLGLCAAGFCYMLCLAVVVNDIQEVLRARSEG